MDYKEAVNIVDETLGLYVCAKCSNNENFSRDKCKNCRLYQAVMLLSELNKKQEINKNLIQKEKEAN